MTSDALDTEGSLVYRESLEHIPGPDGGMLMVRYTHPDGDLLASKSVEYQCRPTTPSYRMSGADGQLLESVSLGRLGADGAVGRILRYPADSRGTLPSSTRGSTIRSSCTGTPLSAERNSISIISLPARAASSICVSNWMSRRRNGSSLAARTWSIFGSRRQIPSCACSQRPSTCLTAGTTGR